MDQEALAKAWAEEPGMTYITPAGELRRWYQIWIRKSNNVFSLVHISATDDDWRWWHVQVAADEHRSACDVDHMPDNPYEMYDDRCFVELVYDA